jgi:hypothetical protein
LGRWELAGNHEVVLLTGEGCESPGGAQPWVELHDATLEPEVLDGAVEALQSDSPQVVRPGAGVATSMTYATLSCAWSLPDALPLSSASPKSVGSRTRVIATGADWAA